MSWRVSSWCPLPWVCPAHCLANASQWRHSGHLGAWDDYPQNHTIDAILSPASRLYLENTNIQSQSNLCLHSIPIHTDICVCCNTIQSQLSLLAGRPVQTHTHTWISPVFTAGKVVSTHISGYHSGIVKSFGVSGSMIRYQLSDECDILNVPDWHIVLEFIHTGCWINDTLWQVANLHSSFLVSKTLWWLVYLHTSFRVSKRSCRVAYLYTTFQVSGTLWRVACLHTTFQVSGTLCQVAHLRTSCRVSGTLWLVAYLLTSRLEMHYGVGYTYQPPRKRHIIEWGYTYQLPGKWHIHMVTVYLHTYQLRGKWHIVAGYLGSYQLPGKSHKSLWHKYVPAFG